MDEVELELDSGRRGERLRQLEPELREPVGDRCHPKRSLASAAWGYRARSAQADEQDREALRGVPRRVRGRPSRLAAPITTLRGAGPKLAAAAAAIGIETIGDLLWHVPHGHRDRAGVREVAELRSARRRRCWSRCARRGCATPTAAT